MCDDLFKKKNVIYIYSQLVNFILYDYKSLKIQIN